MWVHAPRRESGFGDVFVDRESLGSGLGWMSCLSGGRLFGGKGSAELAHFAGLLWLPVSVDG